MASRTPPLQERSRFHSHWGTYASASALPNASGAALPVEQFSLEPGDVAYVTGDGLYTCVDAGAAGLADAVWIAVSRTRARESEGFSVANFLATAAGAVAGSATMTYIAVWRMKHGTQGTANGFVGGNLVLFAGGGFGLYYDATRLKYFVFDGGTNLIQNFVNATWPGTSGGHAGLADFASGSIVHQALTFDGANLRCYAQGRLQRTQEVVSAGYTAPLVAGPHRFGYTPNNGGYVLDGAGWLGALYRDNLVATEDQIFAHYLECRDALGVPAGSLAPQHRWDISQLPLGAAPATVPDLGSVGTATLTLTGALTVRDRYPSFLQSGGSY